jgi:hypothetical protein
MNSELEAARRLGRTLLKAGCEQPEQVDRLVHIMVEAVNEYLEVEPLNAGVVTTAYGHMAVAGLQLLARQYQSMNSGEVPVGQLSAGVAFLFGELLQKEAELWPAC